MVLPDHRGKASAFWWERYGWGKQEPWTTEALGSQEWIRPGWACTWGISTSRKKGGAAVADAKPVTEKLVVVDGVLDCC